jgi:hypothetical protein
MKACEQCKAEMDRPRWKNGKLDAMWRHRRFCSSRCYGDWVLSQKRATRRSGRKQAQRAVPTMTECNRCQTVSRLQRHHQDRDPLNNSPENIEILCQECHKNEHMKDKTWGLDGFKSRIYRELRQEFLTEFTDLEPLETPSSPPSSK